MHKYKLLVQLFQWSLVVTVIMVIVLVIIELNAIDNFMVELVKDEAHSLSRNIDLTAEKSTSSNNSLPKKLKNILEERATIQNNHFISIELYNTRNELVTEVKKKGAEFVINAVHDNAHNFPHTGSSWHRKTIVSAQLYVQTMVPLFNENSEIIGYLEGVFHISNLTLIGIGQQVVMHASLLALIVMLTALFLYPTILRQERSLVQYAKDLTQANIAMLKVLGNSIAKRDSDTDDHNYRVTLYSLMFARQLNCDNDEIRKLIIGAFLHDVGKIGISDQILLKPGKLTEDEFLEMKHHVNHGIDIIEGTRWLEGAKEVIRCHHEKFDGSGYPNGLKGSEIPLSARIFAIVDVFDALTSKRPYKQPLTVESAKAILSNGDGAHFDPILLHYFLSMVDSYYKEVYEASRNELEIQLNQKINEFFNDEDFHRLYGCSEHTP